VTAAGTFEALAAALDVGLVGARAGSTAVDPSVALGRVDRDGTATDVRYHGPLLAEAADGEVSPDDVSPVAAQELGRMMATADARFTREIVAWHRNANLAQTRRVFSAAVQAALDAPAGLAARSGDVRAVLRQRLAATVGPAADPFGARRLGAAERTDDLADAVEER